MQMILTLRDTVQNIWVNYRLGTISALISMVIVVYTYIKLARSFIKSNNKLKVWPKLLLHAIWRVLLTMCVYFGPVWVIETIIGLAMSVWTNILLFIDFVSHADRLTVILLTTGFVLIVFITVTCVALWQYFKQKYKTWKEKKDAQK